MIEVRQVLKSNACEAYNDLVPARLQASHIDHTGHSNDSMRHLRETLMYKDVMKFVREWIDKHPNTIMMSATDHECGGLTPKWFQSSPPEGR